MVTRYNLADTIYAKAEVDCSQGIVNLWLGANVMLEYTYDEALTLLTSKENLAKKEFKEVSSFEIFLDLVDFEMVFFSRVNFELMDGILTNSDFVDFLCFGR